MPKQMTPEPRWLEPRQTEAWRFLTGVLLLMPGKFDEALQEHGMTFFDYQIMTALSARDDHTQKMSHLAFMTNGSLSRLSHAAKRLEKRGWIRRHRCPEDGRVTLATMTDEGYAVLVKAAPDHVESVRQVVFDHLDKEQVDQLFDLCSTLVRAVSDVAPPWEQDDADRALPR